MVALRLNVAVAESRDDESRRLGDVLPDGELARRLSSAALDERAHLGAEADGAVVADPVGELHSPAAPRRHALDEWISVVPRVPRAAGEEHETLLMFSRHTGTATGVPHLIGLGITRTCRAPGPIARKMSPLSRGLRIGKIFRAGAAFASTHQRRAGIIERDL
jgi:hypothetical protein